MSFLGWFRRKVVHVQVVQNHAVIDQRNHLARYTVNGHLEELPFAGPKPLGYSSEIKKHVRGHFSPLKKWFVVIKVWRQDEVKQSHKRERWIGWVMASSVVMGGGIITVLALSNLVLQLQMSSVDDSGTQSETAIQVVLLGNIAVSAATAAGIYLIRALRFSEPFDTSFGWVAKNLGPVVVVLAFNGALLYGFVPNWETPELKALLTAAGLIGSVTAAFFAAVLSTLRWTAIEELQRKSLRARHIADWLEKRTRA